MPVAGGPPTVDVSRLVAPATKQKTSAVLQGFKDRASKALSAYKPTGPEERLAWYERVGFRPHGLFIPDDAEEAKKIIQLAVVPPLPPGGPQEGLPPGPGMMPPGPGGPAGPGGPPPPPMPMQSVTPPSPPPPGVGQDHPNWNLMERINKRESEG